MARSRDLPGGRRPPPRATDDVVSSEISDDTTLLPGLDDDEDVTAAGEGFANAPTTSPDARTPPATPDVEDVEVFVSSLPRAHASGVYASLMARDERATSFAATPAPESAAGALFPPLPEMSAEIWQAGLRALVTVPE
ncbi:MAG TPA: hypothetical protein VK989_11645, partial [Polyangia bacterium]|nr:hypothetical protein [Polyangia bacterium]